MAQRKGSTAKRTIGYTVELGETMAGFLTWLAKRSNTTPQAYARKIVVEALESTLEQLTPAEAKALLDESDLARDRRMLDSDPMVTTVEAVYATKKTTDLKS